MNKKKKFLSLSVDLEEFGLPLEYACAISKKQQYEISLQGLRCLTGFLKKHNLKVTFFATTNMAEAFPESLQSLSCDGHEVALHAVMEEEEKKSGFCLRNQKSTVEQIIGKKIYGCRTHRLAPLPTRILNEAGLLYDNSLHPTYVPGRYCNIFKPKRIHINEGIVKVPVSVTPVSNLPFSWFWFRNFGFHYAVFCSKAVYLNRDYINIYFHSWDFAKINISLKWNLKPLIRNTGYKMLSILDRYINWCRRERLEIIPILDYLRMDMGLECGV